MIARRLALAIALVAGACRSGGSDRAAEPVPLPAPPPAEPAPVAKKEEAPVKVDLSVRLEALLKNGKQSVVESGQVLRSGDRVALHVEVTAPAYVYVALVGTDGAPSIIFPREGDIQVDTGEPFRIPAAGQWFRLDQDAGYEDLFVFASAKALSRDDVLARARTRAEQVAEARKRQERRRNKPTPKSPALAKVDAPGALTDDTRGLVLDEAPAPASTDGVTHQHVSIKHAR